MATKPLDDLPEFFAEVVEIDDSTLSKMSPVDRALHTHITSLRKEISVLRKENRWLAEKIILSFNLGLTHEALIENTRRSVFGIPSRALMYIITAVTGAAAVKLAEMIFK